MLNAKAINKIFQLGKKIVTFTKFQDSFWKYGPSNTDNSVGEGPNFQKEKLVKNVFYSSFTLSCKYWLCKMGKKLKKKLRKSTYFNGSGYSQSTANIQITIRSLHRKKRTWCSIITYDNAEPRNAFNQTRNSNFHIETANSR